MPASVGKVQGAIMQKSFFSWKIHRGLFFFFFYLCWTARYTEMIQNYAIIIVHLLWCGRTTRMALCEDWLFDYNTDWTV